MSPTSEALVIGDALIVGANFARVAIAVIGAAVLPDRGVGAASGTVLDIAAGIDRARIIVVTILGRFAAIVNCAVAAHAAAASIVRARIVVVTIDVIACVIERATGREHDDCEHSTKRAERRNSLQACHFC